MFFIHFPLGQNTQKESIELIFEAIKEALSDKEIKLLIHREYLDGGNLLKSIIWHFSGSKNKGRNFLNKVNLSLSFLVLIFGIICLFRFNFYYGFILSFLGLFGSRADLKSPSE